MSRVELSRLLSILIRQGQITPAEAQTVLRLFDAGQLDARTLPLPFAESNRAIDYAAALAAVALLLGTGYGRRLLTAAPIPLFARQQARDKLRDAFDRRATRLAGQLSTSGNVRVWHGTMATDIGQHIARQFIAGAGRAPVAERATLTALVATQLAFLYRFAGQMAVRVATERPLSAGYVANRSKQYSGAGWRAWHEGNEVREGQGDGTVVYFVSLDSPTTCSPCHDAARNSPYLVNDHPWPATICRGGGNCRCTLRYEHDPEVWSRLSGRRLAA